METPVVSLDLHGDDTSGLQVVSETWQQEIREVCQPGVVAYHQQAVEAIVLGNDNVQ